MHVKQMDRYAVDISDEIYGWYKDTYKDETAIDILLSRFAILDFNNIQNLVANAGLSIPQSMRMLWAHGYTCNDCYQYVDKWNGKKEFGRVEDWIEIHEEHNDVLYICVCNRSQHELKPRKSILVYPATALRGTEVHYAVRGKGSNILRVVPSR